MLTLSITINHDNSYDSYVNSLSTRGINLVPGSGVGTGGGARAPPKKNPSGMILIT